MSNNISVRRVKVQTINKDGTPDGEPTFGVMAADSYEQAYNDTFATLEELNEEINNTGSILSIVEPAFNDIDAPHIGTDNYYGPAEIDNFE